jgi:hypothetical protein
MRRLQRQWAIQLLIMCAAANAAAAGPEAASEASTHFNRAVQLYREGNLDAALAEFTRANELAPNYRLLYNMAQVQAERHDYVRALQLMQAYLQQGGAEIPAARRAEVEQEQTRLRERVALLWVSADAPGAKLFVNEEPVASLPLQALVPLNPGLIRVRVEADGRKPYIGDLNVAGGDRPRLEVALEVQPMVATGPREPEIDYTPVWISGVAAGALGIGALTFALVTSKANDDLDEQLDTFPGNASEIEDQRSKIKTFAGLTDGFAIGTLLAAGVGAYYLIFPLYVSEEHPEQGEAVRVSAGLGGITVDGTF